MKTLTTIRLINWHLFENATIPVAGTTYFIGVNGVGKSTILDAVQFALIGGQRDVRFNQAAVAGGKRTLASYVRGELGTEGQRYLRGDATAVIALEFKNDDGSWFAHGAVVDAYEDGRTPDAAYFIAHNARLSDDWFFKPQPANGRSSVLDTREFKRHLEHTRLPPGARAQVFTRVEDYRAHLLNRLGQLRETFPAKITKGLAFSPLTDIRAFVHGFLLDEHLVDVKTLQAQLDTLRHFEALAANVRDRIAALDEIVALDEERIANRRRRITNGVVRRRAEADLLSADLAACQAELQATSLELAHAEREREALAAQVALAEGRLLDAKLALQSDAAALQEQQLRDRIAAAEAELGQLREVQSRLAQALRAEQAGLARLSALLAQDAVEPPAEFAAARAIDPATAQPAELQAVIAALEAQGNAFARDEAVLGERARGLREEAERLAAEIRQLRSGDREASFEAEAPEAARLRRLLRAELGLGADEVIFLCSALDVPDERWQDAVEGVLGATRFTLLVPPQRYDEAMRVYRRLRHEQHLHGAGVLDAERIIRHAAARERAGSLADEVASADAAARAFADLVLGGYVKCDSLEDMRPHRTAVTRECFVRRNYSTSHLNPRAYKRWFIGARALPRQIEGREARIAEIAGELADLHAALAIARERLSLSRDRVRAWLGIERDLPAAQRAPALAEQVAQLRADLAALDTRSVEHLRAEVHDRQREFDQIKAQADALLVRLGQRQAQAAALAGERIPALQRAADAAAQAVEIFLAGEDADDLRDDVAKEYERRRERQPLDRIRENSANYEGDYQTAEQRSRDRLRAAKQTYSLRHDFGGDDDEDAARYAAERQRFVQSELPEYEAQITRQRNLAEQELVENFIHRLAEQIEDARAQLGYLNDTLRELRFGGERFEFIAQPAPALRPIYDMLMDSEKVLGDSLFETDFRRVHQQAWDLLFERLTRDDEVNAELRELQDYRNYLDYDVRIHYPGGDRALLSKISAKKSGGETTTPFYVAMAASFAQAYRLNQPSGGDTIRLALFDEAFSKMDTARTASALAFMRGIGLQVLLATPPDKSGALLPYVDSVRTVVKKDNRSFVIELDRAGMLENLETS